MAHAQLTDVTTVKNQLEAKTQITDPVITALIAAVSTAIRKVCDQPVGPEVVTWEFFGTGTFRVLVPFFPVRSVTLIESASTAAGSAWGVDTGAVALYGDGETTPHYLEAAGGFANGTRYRVTLEAGPAVVPPDVKQIATEAVIETLKGTRIAGVGDDRLGKASTSETAGPVGKSKSTAFVRLRDEHLARLAPYVRW